MKGKIMDCRYVVKEFIIPGAGEAIRFASEAEAKKYVVMRRAEGFKGSMELEEIDEGGYSQRLYPNGNSFTM